MSIKETLKNKRVVVLLSLLGVVSVTLVPKIMSNLNTEDVPSVKSILPEVSITQNKAVASENKVNKDKIQVEKLINTTYALKSVNTVTPFQTSIATNIKLSKKGSSDINQSNLNSLPSSVNVNDQTLKNNISAKPASAPNNKEQDIQLKAIASNNAQSIAVVEVDGKTSSIVVGSKIGEYQVVDIQDKQIVLSNTNGEKTVNFSK